MSTQLLLDLHDPRSAAALPEKHRRLLEKIRRLLQLEPDIVSRLSEGVWREMRTLQKVTCDVVAFVVRCRLCLDVDNDVLPWLTRKICALDARIGAALKPRRSAVEKINGLLNP